MEWKYSHAGVLHGFIRFAGAYPPNTWSNGGIRKTPRAPPSREPQQLAPKRKKKRCACWAEVSGYLASVSELLLGQSGHVRAPPAAGFGLYPRLTKKTGGMPPFDHCPKKRHGPLDSNLRLQVERLPS